MRVGLLKLSSLGDVVHALPVASALRAHLPHARLTWIVERREAALLRDNAALDELFSVDLRAWRRARGPRGRADAARALVQLVGRLRAARFDVVIDLQGLIKTGLLTAATGARVRIGFVGAYCRESLNALFTNRRVRPPAAARHVVDQYLSLLEPLGVRAATAEFPLPSDPAAEARVQAFLDAAALRAGGGLVVLNPGAGRADKRWPAGQFRELARRLVAEAGAAVLVVWGPEELGWAREIVAGADRGQAALAPPTSLDELVAVLRRASVVVAGDTGPLHLAAALGTPCVGLYGPTPAARNAPYGRGHRALESPDGTLASLDPDAVFHAVAELLGRPVPLAGAGGAE